MALVEPMIELLRKIDALPDEPTSLELCLSMRGWWRYATIQRNPSLTYSYHLDNMLEKEELMNHLAKLNSGQIAVIAYYEEPQPIEDTDYLTVENKKVDGQYQIVFQREVSPT